MTDVAVVIPTFGDTATIELAVRSALDQRTPASEIVVVNDAGPDPTPALGRLAERVEVVHHETNRGASVARETGLRSTSSRYVVFLDADDALAPCFVEVMAGALDRDPQAGFAVCEAERVPDGEVADRWAALAAVAAASGPRDRVVDRLDRSELFGLVTTRTGFFIPSASLFRRSMLPPGRHGEVWDPRFRVGQDWHLFVRLAVRHPGLVVRAPLGVHRRRTGSLSDDDIGVWVDRRDSITALLDEDAMVSADATVVDRLVRLRGAAARRVARSQLADGDVDAARATVRGDLTARASWRSAVYRLVLAGPPAVSRRLLAP